MKPIAGCRLPVNGHPSFGWWSLDPGMDVFYLWRMSVAGSWGLDPWRKYGIRWWDLVTDEIRSSLSEASATLAPSGTAG